MPHRSHAELFYHFVWSTHKRETTISESWENRLFSFIKEKSIELQSPIIEINGTKDHIHVLLRASTNLSPAKIAHDLKGASSYMINKAGLCAFKFSWQDGYGVFSVSPRDVDMIARYILNQKQHHADDAIRTEWEVSDDSEGVCPEQGMG